MAQTAVVILNWNTQDILNTYLPSVVKYSTQPNVEIVVADNGSSDDSVAFVREHYPQITIIELKENYGFAGGYNKALEQVNADYYILLNSDVEVSEGWIDPVINRMENNKGIAACMPRIRSYTEKDKFEYAGAAGGYIDKFGFPFCRGRILDDVEVDNDQYDTASEVFWATGACMFVRAEAYHDVNGFDADFFAHMEEIDLCWRFKNRGYQVWYEPESIVYHLGGGTLPYDSPKKLYLNFRNNLWLLYKNLPEENLRKTIVLRMVFDGVAALKFVAEGKLFGLSSVAKAHQDFYYGLKVLKQKRAQLPVRNRNTKGMYQRSIVFDFYLRKKRRFSDLFIR